MSANVLQFLGNLQWREEKGIIGTATQRPLLAVCVTERDRHGIPSKQLLFLKLNSTAAFRLLVGSVCVCVCVCVCCLIGGPVKIVCYGPLLCRVK